MSCVFVPRLADSSSPVAVDSQPVWRNIWTIIEKPDPEVFKGGGTGFGLVVQMMSIKVIFGRELFLREQHPQLPDVAIWWSPQLKTHRRFGDSHLEWLHTWKQIVSTFIKHSLQEINITKLFPPKLAYFFNQCIIVNQLAVFKQQHFIFFWRPLNIKYVQKGQDCCNQKLNGLQFINSSTVSASQMFLSTLSKNRPKT